MSGTEQQSEVAGPRVPGEDETRSQEAAQRKPWWTNGTENRKSHEQPGPEWRRGMTRRVDTEREAA